MRQRVGLKKVRKWRTETGLPICWALVRGGTDHRRDLMVPGGVVYYWYKDGTFEKSRFMWDDAEYDYSEINSWWTANSDKCHIDK